MDDPARQWRELRGSRVSVPDHVVFRDMAQETVLLNIRTGRYHGIDPIGAHFFEVMRSGDPLARVAGVLADDYKQPIERIEHDLAAFCAEMASLELIELHADHG
jgi:coenzyme PQQ synthesis protein D (PqqD)